MAPMSSLSVAHQTLIRLDTESRRYESFEIVLVTNNARLASRVCSRGRNRVLLSSRDSRVATTFVMPINYAVPDTMGYTDAIVSIRGIASFSGSSCGHDGQRGLAAVLAQVSTSVKRRYFSCSLHTSSGP
jgi:hypothetical protein